MKKKRLIAGIGAVVLGVILNSAVFAYPIQYVEQDQALDFESGYSEGDNTVLLERNGVDGNALKMLHGGQLAVNFGSEVNPYANAAYDGQYLLSFDAYMSNVDDSVKLLTFVQTNTKENPKAFSAQKQFMHFSGGAVTNGEKGSLISSAGYQAGKWQHYDLLLSLYEDEENTAELYIDGSFSGVMNLTNSGIYGIGRMIFLFGNYTGGAVKDAYALVDNIRMGKFKGKASGTLSCTKEDYLRITFSETMPEMHTEDFKITRKAPDGSEENVPFTLGKTTRTSAELIVEALEGGVYTVSYLGETVFGKTIPDMTYTRNPSEKINVSWDFEDGKQIAGEKNLHTPVYEENRGMVFDFNGADYIPFKLDHALTQGKYILSYDAKYDAVKKDFILRTLNADGVWGYYQVLAGQDGIRQNDNTGRQDFIAGAQHVFQAERWYRIDNVMNLDTAMAEVYVDGEYIGDSALWDSINLANTPMKGFTGIYPWWQNGAGQLDNVRIKNVEKTYGVKLHAEQNRLYLDFDETTMGLSKDQFRVTSAENVLSEEKEEEFELIYQNGTRAILELPSGINLDQCYRVSLNGIKSFLGHSLAENILTVSKSGFTKILAEDAEGKTYALQNAPSDTRKLLFYSSSALNNPETNGAITILSGETSITGTKSYDAEKQILTLTLDKLLGADRSYRIGISGFVNADGSEIPELSGEFQTGTAFSRLGTPALSRNADSVEIQVNWINTKEDQSYSMILVGYQEGVLKMAAIQPLTGQKDDSEITKTIIFSGDMQGYDSLSAFIWEDYTHIRPLARSVTK